MADETPRKRSMDGSPLRFDAERVLMNVRASETEDLLDRVTAYRAGLEPEAVMIIERELRLRGVTEEEIEAHAEWCRREVVFDPDGVAYKCSFCHRPAVAQTRGWQLLLGLVPLFPRLFSYCPDHRPVERPS
jgi:hypothetical protein